MTTAADWSQGVDPMPSMESSSDLFDGDILGDELIDIYNAAVVGGSDDDNMNGSTKNEPTAQQPAAEESSEDTAADDGLGAFRPSTSFNDLTTLLPPTTSSVGGDKSQQLTPVVSSTSIKSKTEAPKKRPSTSSSDAPVSKRRATGGRKTGGTTSKKGGKTGLGSKASKGTSGKQSTNTPNPLTAGGQLAVAAPSGTKSIKPIVKPAEVPSSGAAVVTPRLPSKVDSANDSSSTLARTEADFKSVAQVAVSNLIMNVGSNPESSKKAVGYNHDASEEKIDTSTEHIKALTGSNWVAVCSGDGNSSSSGVAADKMNNRATRRQNLTADERARQNRDRNREHARNTRLRKKAYVEELKRTLTALVTQRDATEVEKRHSAQRELEQREVRFRVVEEFLKLRGRNEQNYARWAAILEDSFAFTLPKTHFREMISVKDAHFEQELTGVSEAMADSGALGNFLQGLGKEDDGTVSLVYSCDRKNFFMDNCTAVLNWTAITQGAVQKGAPSELTLKGNLSAKYSPASNKLISVSMTFDTGAIASQMNQLFKNPLGVEYQAEDTDAAQAAASEADALLDSLQMPHIATSSVPSNVTVVPASAASITDGEKSVSSDESNGDAEGNDEALTTRRALRVRED